MFRREATEEEEEAEIAALLAAGIVMDPTLLVWDRCGQVQRR
jgi:hypothetical protein